MRRQLAEATAGADARTSVEPGVSEEALLRVQEHTLALERTLQHVRQELQLAFEEKNELTALLSQHLSGSGDPSQQAALDAQARALDDRAAFLEEAEKDQAERQTLLEGRLLPRSAARLLTVALLPLRQSTTTTLGDYP